MFSLIRLGLHDLVRRWQTALPMSLVVAVSLMAYLTLQGYQAGLATGYGQVAQPWLIVQQSNMLGEFSDSRVAATAVNDLFALGVSQAIPQIHAVAGSSVQDAVVLRGVDLGQYQQIEPFTLVAGRALQEGDPPRLALVGYRLAQAKGVAPGETVSLRGRDFTVVGLFRVGSYADNEAWIALTDAQTLLGWENEVSLFVIPDEGILHEGVEIAGGLVVARKGAAAEILARQWQPLFNLLSVCALALGVAAALTLTNLLWRLAWMRRRNLAILRAVGFGQPALTVYLLAQAGCITAVGLLLAFSGVAGLTSALSINNTGQYLPWILNGDVLSNILALSLLITFFGAAVPAWQLSRLNLALLLREE